MGRTANLSPLGLYEWDNTMFDLITIPSGLNKDVLVKNILAETAELEVLYANPFVMKNLIGVWSNKNLEVWEKLYATTQLEYNPIENYNRYETGSTEGADTTTHSGTDTETINRTKGGTYGVDLGGTDTLTHADEKGHWIAGYDSTASGSDDGLVKQTRDMDNSTSSTRYGKTEDGTYSDTEGVTDAKVHGEKITSEKDGSHTLHAHGNIGVTTTQRMVELEREIDLFNIYDIIISDFKARFCIMVY